MSTSIQNAVDFLRSRGFKILEHGEDDPIDYIIIYSTPRKVIQMSGDVLRLMRANGCTDIWVQSNVADFPDGTHAVVVVYDEQKSGQLRTFSAVRILN